MVHVYDVAWGVLGIIAILLALAVSFLLTPNARLRRRLRKTRGRIVSRSQQPAIKLSVKPPKK
jgi:hypothetical protein